MLVKAFMSAGAAILPFMILFFSNHDMNYGYAFFVPAAIFFINMIFLLTVSFPNPSKIPNNKSAESYESFHFHSKPNFMKRDLPLLLSGSLQLVCLLFHKLGYLLMVRKLGMTTANSIKLLSYYSVGSLISVLTRNL